MVCNWLNQKNRITHYTITDLAVKEDKLALVVMSTNFQHKGIQKITWLSPDQNIDSQIDHVIINSNKKGVIEYVKSMRGPNRDSDHFLVKTVIKQKLGVIHKKKLKPILKLNKINL